MSDTAILQELGQRLARYRIDSGLTQVDLAEQSGVSKRTLERIEAGQSTQTSTFIRILRGLDLLDAFDKAIPAPDTRPLDLLRLKGKRRQRVSSKQHQMAKDESWHWGDES
jgi:transcriptional regulator with XRE-family HTH domain